MKPNQTRIIIPGETMPVHSFDLWGTLVQQDVLGPRVLNAYREVMDGRINPLEIDQNVENYEGVLRGDPRSLEHKKDYVNTIEDPVWDAFLGGRVNINFNGVFYQDSLQE